MEVPTQQAAQHVTRQGWHRQVVGRFSANWIKGITEGRNGAEPRCTMPHGGYVHFYGVVGIEFLSGRANL